MSSLDILLVDDERSIVSMMEKVLKKEGYFSIKTAYSVSGALDLIHSTPFDIIILDVTLPDGNGFDLGPKIRERSNSYIIYLTARTTDFDVLTGFAMGGDDYVTKPFNPLEIVARIKAVERRLSLSSNENKTKPHIYNFGFFQVNELTKELVVNGQVKNCSALLFRLLVYLCQHPNRVFTKNDLFEAVWGMENVVDDNTIMVHIRRLRERIEPNPSDPQFLVTVRGLGYKLVQSDTYEKN